MRMLKLVDTTTTAMVNIIPSDRIAAIQTTNANTILIYADIVGATGTAGVNVGVDSITITATAKAIVVAERLANHIAATNIGGASVLDVTAASALFPEISAIVYAAVV